MLRLQATTDPDVMLLDGDGSVMTVSPSGLFFLAREFTGYPDSSGRVRHDVLVLSAVTGESVLEILTGHGCQAELFGEDKLWILRQPTGTNTSALLEARAVPDEAAYASIVVPDARETQGIIPSRGGAVMLQTATTDYLPSITTARFTLVDLQSFEILGRFEARSALAYLRSRHLPYRNVPQDASIRVAFHPDGNRLALQLKMGNERDLRSVVVVLDELPQGGVWHPWIAEIPYSGSSFHWIGPQSLADVGVDLPSDGFLFSKRRVGEDASDFCSIRVTDIEAPHFDYQVLPGSCLVDDSDQFVAFFGKNKHQQDFGLAVYDLDSMRRIGQQTIRTRRDVAAVTWHRGVLWVARLQTDTRIELGSLDILTGRYEARHVVEATKRVGDVWFKPEEPHWLLLGWEEKGFFQASRKRQALIRVN